MIASANASCYPIPSRFLGSCFKKKKPTGLSFSIIKPSCCSSSPSSSSSIQTAHRRIQKQRRKLQNPIENSLPFHEVSSPIDTTNRGNQNPETELEEDSELWFRKTEAQAKGILLIMWWADLRAAVGQRINIDGVVSSVSVLLRDRHMLIPHVAVPDIRYLDWGELKKRGFKGVVFDKDNTLTAPYSLTLWPPLSPSIEQCKSVFGDDIAVFSNSAGLAEYDHAGSKATALEAAIGIRVLRHRVKKPAGTADEIEKHFGCASSQLIMVGDRPFTDIVYGNRNGFLTILTKPLSLAEESFIVRQVRKLELSLLNYCLRRGLMPVSHNLLPYVKQCVKDPSFL